MWGMGLPPAACVPPGQSESKKAVKEVSLETGVTGWSRIQCSKSQVLKQRLVTPQLSL